MAHRLGGVRAKSLTREERLEKLLNSAAYGGEIHIPPPDNNNDLVTLEPIGGAGEGRDEIKSGNSLGHLSSQRRGSKPPVAQPKARAPPRRSNVHTINSVVRTTASTRSRLHDTTEAYRQNRGTTARTIEEVGRDTMTQEKAEQVNRAREKVLNSSSARSSSCGASFSRRVPANTRHSTSSTTAASSSSSNGGSYGRNHNNNHAAPAASSSSGLGQRANVHTLAQSGGNTRGTCAAAAGAGAPAIQATRSHPEAQNGILPVPTSSRRRAVTGRA